MVCTSCGARNPEQSKICRQCGRGLAAGEGGMGAVYRAFDTELERTVALKLVRPELAVNERTMKRFRQELLLASRISHKNILRIHDLGDSGGIKFITMA